MQRTFVRACVKFMAVISFAFVPIAGYQFVVQLAAGDPLGALASLAFAPFGLVLAWVFWTETEGIVDGYMARARPWRGRPTTIESRGPGVGGVDPAALRAHLRAADAAMLALAQQHPDRPDLRWAAIGAWAADEAAWVAGLPDVDRLWPLAGEYAAAATAAQALAADLGDALARGDAAEVERLSAAGADLDRRFRRAFELSDRIAWT